MNKLFNDIYRGTNVLITGNTGFKGSWLALWLTELGANVMGYSKDIPTSPSHFEISNLPYNTVFDNLSNKQRLSEVVATFRPKIIFHLAAQALVRVSYESPIETYETNVIGTANLLEACRNVDSVEAVVVITTDKCYENREWIWGYRENDSLGGYDPYSSSKACAEIVTASYRNSFFNLKDYKKTHNTLIATARAGNVIGGGDWAAYRLVTDIIRATIENRTTLIRYPYATRPWQHVLEPLSGYLMLGQKLLEQEIKFADAWNFGPSDDANLSVLEIIARLKKSWDKIDYKTDPDKNQPHEAGLLKLDISKARHILKWNPLWTIDTTVERTANWYKNYYENNTINSTIDLNAYIEFAKQAEISWVK